MTLAPIPRGFRASVLHFLQRAAQARPR